MQFFPEVEILVLDPGKCPVLRAGDRMMYRHPAVEADRTCAQALATLAPAAEDIARAKMEGRRLEPLQLACPVEDCGAAFVLTAVPERKPASGRASREAIPASRSKTWKVGSRRTSGRGRRKAKRRLLKWAAAVVLIAVLLGGGAFVGVGYLAPRLLPRFLTSQLARWNIPLPREWFSASADEAASDGESAPPSAPEAKTSPPGRIGADLTPGVSVEADDAPSKDLDSPAGKPDAPAEEPGSPVEEADAPAEDADAPADAPGVPVPPGTAETRSSE